MGKKRRVSKKFIPQASIVSDELYIPNHSGMLDAGKIHRTPTDDLDPVNKKYLDDNYYSIVDDKYVLNAGDVMTGTLFLDALGTGLDVLHTAEIGNHLIVGDNLTVDTDTFFVDSVNKRVGIGTLTPGAKLEIVGTGGSTGGWQIKNSNEAFLGYFLDDTADSDFVLTYSGSGGADILVQADGDVRLGLSGNVGIGNVNPVFIGTATGLHTGSSSNSRVMHHFTNSATGVATTDGFEIDLNASNLVFNLRESGTMKFATANTTAMTIDTSQKVGINEVTPLEKLHVVGNVRAQGDNAKFLIYNAAGFDRAQLLIESGFGRLVLDKTDGTAGVSLKGTGDSYITSNLGIATTTPDELFSVADLFLTDSAGNTYWKGEGSGLPFAEIYARDNTTTTSTSTTKTQILIFDTNGKSNAMTADHTNDHLIVLKPGKYPCW